MQRKPRRSHQKHQRIRIRRNPSNNQRKPSPTSVPTASAQQLKVAKSVKSSYAEIIHGMTTMKVMMLYIVTIAANSNSLHVQLKDVRLPARH
jgi:hypothetical protein